MAQAWLEATRRLAAGQATLVSLWAEASDVRMALGNAGSIETLRLACPLSEFPSVGVAHSPAIRLERAIQDLHGFKAVGAVDVRPWLDHGRWGLRAPLGAAVGSPAMGDAYAFREATGPGLHQIPVGPVHAGIIEPGHFRFHCSGETVVRLEERLGYVHKGVDALMRGASLTRGAELAGRISGDSTIAYQYAFARAAESALEVEPPPRAVWLRALMAELERIANHLGDFGAICNDASFALMQAHCSAWRERALRVTSRAFGRRLMMDLIAPGGVMGDLAPDGTAALREFISALRPAFTRLIKLYDDTASLQDRTVRTGIVARALVEQYGAGGYVGRASGRAFDARRALPYPPYDTLKFETPLRADGDVNARVWIRIREIEQSLDLVEQILSLLPTGAIRVEIPARAGEGLALVEGFRGDVFAAVTLGADGALVSAHLRDPSWFQWPLLEAAIEGNIVADFPLINKSFNCSYSGCDL